MGLFCVNFHARTADDRAVTAAMDRRGATDRHVLPAKSGWVSAYEAEASNQDDARVRDLGEHLSRDLKAPVVAFLVHDSDIACYWLFDKGRLLDEYNSCPGYFDGGDDAPTGGRTDLLVRFCRPGVTEEQLADILGSDETFAEGIVEGVAEALGIDAERALSDYRDLSDGDFDDDGDGDDHDGGGPSGGPSLTSRIATGIASLFGGSAVQHAVDPKVQELVGAAVAGDVDAIDALLAEGVDVDAEGRAPFAQRPGVVLPGALPQIPATPLLAAVIHQRLDAVARLLDAGADLNRSHAMYGTALHAAVSGGYVEITRLLIKHGANTTARNPQGQTPLAVLNALRVMRAQMAEAQKMMKSMGIKIPDVAAKLAELPLPTEGWDACERLLREW